MQALSFELESGSRPSGKSGTNISLGNNNLSFLQVQRLDSIESNL